MRLWNGWAKRAATGYAVDPTAMETALAAMQVNLAKEHARLAPSDAALG
jgi:hypothetical protein